MTETEDTTHGRGARRPVVVGGRAAPSGGARGAAPVHAVEIGGRGIVVIAVPCAVDEPRELVDLARAVRAAGAAMLLGRAVAPDPSTDTSTDPVADALASLAAARAASGLPVVVEVRESRHVEYAAAHADALQVGVHHLRDVALLAQLGRAGLPVLIERADATIAALLLAAERVTASGSPHVVLRERGRGAAGPETPDVLDVAAVASLREATRLPVVVDPGRAGGHAGLVTPLALAAVAAGADGLLVRVHPASPARARASGEPSLATDDLAMLLERVAAVAAAVDRELWLPPGAAEPPTEAPPAGLARLRDEIRVVDLALAGLLARRVALAREAGREKRAAGLPIVDAAQERDVLARVREAAAATGLPHADLHAVMRHVVAMSRRAQSHDDGASS